MIYKEEYVEREQEKIAIDIRHQTGKEISWGDIFTTYRKPLIICIFISIFKEINGGMVVAFYSNRIFTTFASERLATYLTNGVGVFSLLGTIVIIIIVDKFNRKSLLSFGLILFGSFLIGIGVFSSINPLTAFTFWM